MTNLSRLSRLKCSFFAGLFAGLLGLGFATNLPAEDRLEALGLQYTPPAGWVTIPQTTLAEAALHATTETMDRAPRYETGFKPPVQGETIGYPYILVEVARIGRVASRELKSFPVIEFDANSEQNRIQVLMEQLETGVDYYDPDTQSLWLKVVVSVGDGQPILGIARTLFTQDGFIRMRAYDEETGQNHQLLFQSLASATLTEEVAYQELSSWEEMMGMLHLRQILLYAIIGVVAALIFCVAKRRSIKKPLSENPG